MIDEETVFILGAGASCPYGYPSGVGLRDYICDEFHKNIRGAFEKSSLRGKKSILLSQAEELSKKFRKSNTPSIDLFLGRNEEQFSEIGKLAIVSSMLDFERGSKLPEDIKPDKQGKDQDWFSFLLQRMTETLINPDSYKRIGNNKVTFITYNYDRSLEHFLFESLRNAFGKASEKEILDQVTNIPILHVYGQIVNLPWQNKGVGIDYIAGEKNSPYGRFGFETLMGWSKNIKVVHEKTRFDNSEIIDKIIGAKRIFFLGFGYAEENLEAAQLGRNLQNGQRLYGTASGKTDRERDIIANKLRNYLKKRHQDLGTCEIRNDLDCKALLMEYL